MFRRRLTLAFALLAAAVVAEGLLAVWALHAANHQVLRGRVASDIHVAYVKLSAHKQRLRTWVSQLQMGAGAEPAVRDQLLADMRDGVALLQALAQQAVALDGAQVSGPLAAEHAQRQDSLSVLANSLFSMAQAVQQARVLGPDTDARQAWQELTDVFDVSQGRNLRTLLAQSMAREAVAVARERQAADASLARMRLLWLSTAATLALLALLAAAHFTRALRRPLLALSAGTQALERGDLAHRIPAVGQDEFSDLARSFNRMAYELERHRSAEADVRHRLEDLVTARTADLQDALETLQQVDTRRRQLLADISHELRTPTTAIRGEAEISLRGREKSSDEYKAALERIAHTSRQLGRLIEDLLTVARNDIDALALRRQRLDLGQLLTEAVEQARALAFERHIRIEVTAPAHPVWIAADAQRLRQVLLIVLDNAVRYSRPGGHVRLLLEVANVGNELVGQARISVQDHGIGISAADLPHVFERHYRADNARTHRADGTGLGLAIGAALSHAHGGQLTLQSTPDRGTTAELLLPLAEMPEPPTTGDRPQTPAKPCV
jgi:two-component system OmpR family sensor kinase